MTEAFICDAIRTPVGRYNGGLAAVRVDDLAAHPIKALMQRNANVDWGAIDDVINTLFDNSVGGNDDAVDAVVFNEQVDDV